MKKKMVTIGALAGMALTVGGVGVSQAAWDTSNLPLGTSSSTPEHIAVLVATTNPNNTGASVVSSVAVSAMTGVNTGATTDRMATLRSGQTYANMGLAPVGPAGSTSAANVVKKPGVWGVAVGSWGDQDDIKNEKGFEYNIYGVMLGYDRNITDSWLVGINAGYANADVDSGITTNTDIDTMNVGLYSSYSFGQTFIDYGVMYSANNADSDRDIRDGDNVYRAIGEPDADVWTVYVQMGYEIPYENFVLTPIVGVQHSSVDSDSYTESDQGSGLGLDVKSSNDDFFSATAGVKGEYFVSNQLHLKGHVKYTHEFSDDLQHMTTARFNAGTAFFNTAGIDIDQNRYNIGIGMKYLLSEDLSLNVDYDLELADEFDAHTGSIGMKYNF